MKEKIEGLKGFIGAPVTIFKLSEWGFPQVWLGKITRIYEKDYAQYKKCPHIEFIPAGKRKAFVFRVYQHTEMIIWEGYQQVNAEGNSVSYESNGMKIKETLCFDQGAFGVAKASVEQEPIFEHFNENF